MMCLDNSVPANTCRATLEFILPIVFAILADGSKGNRRQVAPYQLAPGTEKAFKNEAQREVQWIQ